MKRVLIVLFVAVVGGALFANHMIAKNISDQLDQTAAMLMMFGTLDYDNVSVTPFGDVRINRLAFTPHAGNDSYRVNRVVYEAGSPWGLYNVASGLKEGTPPDRMKLAIEGIHLDLTNELIKAWADDAASRDAMASFEAAGCGDRTHFNFTDYSAMGYINTLSDLTLEYRVMTGGGQFEIKGEFTTEDMNALQFATLLDLDIENAMMAADPGAAFAKAVQLRSASMRAEDRGYMARMLDYCASETGMERSAYLEHHIEAWRANWSQLSMEVGDGVVAAYREYLEQPRGSLAIEVNPRPALDLSQTFLITNPAYMYERLNPTIIANNGQARPMDLTLGVKPVVKVRRQESGSNQGAETTSARSTQPQSTPATRPSGLITVAELSEHLNHRAIITLDNGRRYDGAIEAVEEARLQLRRDLHGGSMVVPIALNDIAEVRLP